MQRQALSTGLVWAGLLALLIAQVVLAMRLAKLQDAVSKISEDRPSVAALPDRAGGGGGGSPSGAGSGTEREPAAGAPSNGSGAPAPEGSPAGSGPIGRAPAANSGGLSAEDVEKLVEKKLKEHDKKNPFAEILNFEDPLVVMERELKLSPIQKTRIQGHLKERDEAAQEIWASGDPRKEWKEMEAKQQELRKKCEENVKRELDLAQQEKYDELKKAGKINDFGGAGVSIMIDRKDDDAPAK